MSRSFRADGFTLIEVIVSMTIMTLVTAVAFAGLSVGIDSWTRGSEKIDELDQRAVVERLLRRQLAGAYPLQFQFGLQEQPAVLFRGRRDRIEFVADYSLMDGLSDFRKITYVFDGRRFLYDEKPILGYVPSEDEEDAVMELAQMSNVRFRFLSRQESGSLEWLEEWTLGMGIPVVVEVGINDEDTIVIPMVNR